MGRKKKLNPAEIHTTNTLKLKEKTSFCDENSQKENRIEVVK